MTFSASFESYNCNKYSNHKLTVDYLFTDSYCSKKMSPDSSGSCGAVCQLQPLLAINLTR